MNRVLVRCPRLRPTTLPLPILHPTPLHWGSDRLLSSVANPIVVPTDLLFPGPAESPVPLPCTVVVACVPRACESPLIS
eukprot:2101471-Rhodomonas_salina.1